MKRGHRQKGEQHDALPRRARVPDVAREAGVSPATVDRVLKAAARLDYLPEGDLHARTAPPPLRIVFLLPAGTNRYLHMLGDMVSFAEDAWSPFNVRCRVHYID